jgi:RNA polymerase primary sigma factor
MKDFNEIVKEIASKNKEIYILRNELWSKLKSLRKLFTPKEYKVMKMRFHERQNLETVGREFGVTRERIRQIEGKALMKIRQHERSQATN